MSENKENQKARSSRSRSSSSSSSSSDDEKKKNLKDKDDKKKEKVLTKKKEKNGRGRSSSSSSSSSSSCSSPSSSDIEYKKLPRDEQKRKKKEKKALRKQLKEQENKKNLKTKQRKEDDKENKRTKDKKPKGKGVKFPNIRANAGAEQKDVNNPEEERGTRANTDATDAKGRANDSDTASNSGKQKKEYKTEELRRLQDILRKERSHIRKPKQREHFPFVWTSLEPYYNTQTAAFLIDLKQEDEDEEKLTESTESENTQKKSRRQKPEEFRHSYVSRSTAQGLCDPWVDLEMDNTILPKIGSAQRTSTGGQERTRGKKSERSESQEKEKKEKKGSTRLPKFPVVPFHAGKENATQRFPYQDIPKFRQEMDQRFSINAPTKVDSDYKRTKDDFYRMDLDKLDEIHPMNRPHMRKAYFAYLQNTPGSRKAVTECVRSLDTTVKQDQPQPTGTPQKAS